MRAQKIVVILISSLIFSMVAHAQTASTIEDMGRQYQSCLNKGENMLGCSKTYNRLLDSMLNAVYNKLRFSLDATQKVELKNEQVQWLSKTDQYFATTKKAFKKNNPGVDPYGEALGGQDDAMIMFDQNAAFVQKRVLELIAKLQKATKK